jgi:TRAP transporter TAXI family solute receptor
MVLSPGVSDAAKTRLAFSGGPEGGTFQYFSNGIATRLSKNMADVEVSNMASAGSVENLRRVNSGDADFGIVYSGDLFLARNGKLPQDEKKYENVLAMAYLYGAPAHLVVLEGSGITSPAGLVGKKVAVGGAGSGAAASAERYFKALDLWEKMQPQFIGYSEAVSAMGDKLIDAVWVFAGFPNSAVIQAAASNKILVLDTFAAGQAAGFFDEYPFYTEVIIPAGTYSGIDHDVTTFQDSALWVTGKHVKADLVSAALKDIYSTEGLAYMVKVKSTAKAMSVPCGLNCIVTPIHEGAKTFWTSKGLSVTERQSAK